MTNRLTGDDFDTATSAFATDDPNRFEVVLHSKWTVLGKPNGGYLVALLARCGGLVVQRLNPSHNVCVASATSFAGAAEIGRAFVEITVIRSARSVTFVRASLEQDDRRSVETSLIFSPLSEDARRHFDSLPPPELPDREHCVAMPSSGGVAPAIGILEGTDERMDPATMDWSKGLDGIAELRGWASFADGRPIDALSLHYFLDCFPPATFPLGSSGWVPTLQFTSYVRAIPAPGPVKIRQSAQVIEDGYVNEVCEIWDSRDRLVAQATQLALVRF